MMQRFAILSASEGTSFDDVPLMNSTTAFVTRTGSGICVNATSGEIVGATV
jgi:hypothetical protein